MVINTSVGSSAFRYLGYSLEYINESSNTIIQTTNTSNITISPTIQPYDYWRSYLSSNAGFVCWPIPQTNLGVAFACQWLIDTQANFVQDYSNCSFLTKISNYVGQVTKNGKYRISFSGNTSDTNIHIVVLSSSTGLTNSFTNTLACATTENGSPPATWSLNQIVDIAAGTYISISTTNSSANTHTRINGLLELIPSNYTQINSITNNTYLNPATTAPARLGINRIRNDGTPNINLQSTTGFLCIQASTLPYLNIDNNNLGISLTTSPNNTTSTIITVQRNMKVRVNIFFQMYSAATLSGIQFALWNITDSYSEIWNLWTASTTSQSHGQLVGIVTLSALKQYTLDFGTGTANQGLQVRSFGLVIEELIETAQDTFTFSNSGVKSVTNQNTGTGQSAFALKDTSQSWRM